MWALGVLLYALLSGGYPFKASENKELYRRISKGVYSMPSNITAEAKDLICHLLMTDSSKRISADDVLRHSFIIETKASEKCVH